VILLTRQPNVIWRNDVSGSIGISDYQVQKNSLDLPTGAHYVQLASRQV